MAFYCNGKKDFCDCDFICEDCKYFDNTGGKKVNGFWAKIMKWLQRKR